MMPKKNPDSIVNKCILLGILLVGIILRFYHYADIPFTHDEFSALFRTRYAGFSELIEKGVKGLDTHPPGIQVFLYYWIQLFGNAEWIVKLPFTLFGLLSVVLAYLIAKKWYNETVGLIVAAFFSSIQYMVMYSQIARPYISGLFFSLAMVYFWTQLIFKPEKHFYRNSLFYILFASFCAYNHHFSLLLAAIVGLTGLFLIQKEYILKYILNAIVILALYIPNIPIVLHQLKQGGVEDWLAKPQNDFIIDYVSYVFQFSTIIFLLVAGLIVYGFVKKGMFNYKLFIVSILWFFLPFLIGFFYSKYVNAVLQYSVLIFCFPFLLFILFGHIKAQKPIINIIIVALILSTNVFALIKERRHYTLFYDSPYEKILQDHEKAHNDQNKVVSLVDSYKNISQHYWNRIPVKNPFFWFDSIDDEKQLMSFVKEQAEKADYFYLGCISLNPPTTVPIIQEYFPNIEWQKNYQAATTYLFSKKESKQSHVISKLDFDSDSENGWKSLNKANYVDTISYSGKKAYLIDSLTEYSCTFSKPLSEIISNRYNFVDISVKILVPERYKDIILVASLDSEGKSIYWGGTSFDKFITNEDTGEWLTVYHSIKLSDIYLRHKNIQVNVFIWNKEKQNFMIDDFLIRLRDGNPFIYTLLNKIPK